MCSVTHAGQYRDTSGTALWFQRSLAAPQSLFAFSSLLLVRFERSAFSIAHLFRLPPSLQTTAPCHVATVSANRVSTSCRPTRWPLLPHTANTTTLVTERSNLSTPDVDLRGCDPGSSRRPQRRTRCGKSKQVGCEMMLSCGGIHQFELPYCKIYSRCRFLISPS